MKVCIKLSQNKCQFSEIYEHFAACLEFLKQVKYKKIQCHYLGGESILNSSICLFIPDQNIKWSNIKFTYLTLYISL